MEARRAFELAKAADPLSPEPDLYLVQVDVVEGKVDEGRKRLAAMLANGNHRPNVRLWLGSLELAKGNQAEAIEQFRRVVEIDPDNAQALNNLAYLLAERDHQGEQALKYAQRAVELAPDQPAYYDTLGWILYQKGLYNPAIKYLERASSEPGNVAWKYHLSMAYAKGGDSKRGRATLDAALKLNPNLPEAAVAKQVLGNSQ
jgi:tetratricopeptide (TPR) repeat protein